MIRTLAAVLTAAALFRPAHALETSLKKESRHSLEQGLRFLVKSQDAKGFWTTPQYPGLTGLVVLALNHMPADLKAKVPAATEAKAEAFLLSSVKADGGIYNADMTNYNTALAMMALASTQNPKYLPVIKKARAFLAAQQQDKGKAGVADSTLDGGIGYGDDGPFPDLNNTYFALEALRLTNAVDVESREGKVNYELALKFVQRCQNLAAANDLGPAATDPGNAGGLYYSPTESKAGDTTLAGKKVHRSYGAATCMGLLAYVYADVPPNDPKLKAAMAWLQDHYTVDEHPNMGQNSYYFYMLAMTKAFKVLAVEKVATPKGERDWKREAAEKLVSLQKADGSWSNTSGRWWENDPNLASAYALQALEFAL